MANFAAASQSATSYERLTPKLMFQIAAPHTWPAAIMPVLLAAAFTYGIMGITRPIMTLLLLLIVICMQAAANAINDHYDFLKGTDSTADSVDANDAVLVYHHLRPRSVMLFGAALLVVAFLLGIPVIMEAGLFPLIIAGIGAAAAALYSAGRLPLCHLPLGELVSGTVMGGLVPLACTYALSYGLLGAEVLLWSVPTILAILNIAYSKGLKNHPVLDVAIVALGFVLRILFGGYCCDIPISLWLYLTTFSFSLFFALGKRRGELARIGTDSRKALEKYNNTFLSTTMNSFLTCGMVFMSLWAFEKVAPITASVSAASLLVVAGIPLVMIICMRYTYDLERSECEGDPVNVLLADKALVVLTLLCVLAMFCSLYLVG